MKGSVKIMLSYDYNHFEVALASDDDMTLEEIDEMRKNAQRLADKAVTQYKIAKIAAEKRAKLVREKEELEKEVALLKQTKLESEWTAEEKAKVKALEDKKYWDRHQYDYDDDYDDSEAEIF